MRNVGGGARRDHTGAVAPIYDIGNKQAGHKP